MTPQPQHPQPHPRRCEFEPFCRHYCPASQGSGPCIKGERINCPFDTRSHSSAGAQQQRIEQVINILEMQIGCSNMLWEDGGDSKEDAYHQLVDECRKALTLLQAGEQHE